MCTVCCSLRNSATSIACVSPTECCDAVVPATLRSSLKPLVAIEEGPIVAEAIAVAGFCTKEGKVDKEEVDTDGLVKLGMCGTATIMSGCVGTVGTVNEGLWVKRFANWC